MLFGSSNNGIATTRPCKNSLRLNSRRDINDTSLGGPRRGDPRGGVPLWEDKTSPFLTKKWIRLCPLGASGTPTIDSFQTAQRATERFAFAFDSFGVYLPRRFALDSSHHLSSIGVRRDPLTKDRGLTEREKPYDKVSLFA